MCYVCEPVNTSESDKEYEYEHRVIEHIKADPFHFPPSSRLGPESPQNATVARWVSGNTTEFGRVREDMLEKTKRQVGNACHNGPGEITGHVNQQKLL
jgi:hypothetical protein